MNAAIYARYSSDNQREASIEDQFRVCREYCQAHGLTVVQEYHDNAISGLTDARPDFQRMIKDGERRVFDVLVLYALDRFARNKYDSAIYKARLKKAGVKIVYVTSPIGEGPESILMESLLEGLSQYYSENLARNIRRGLEGNALRGIWSAGKVPFGYLRTPNRTLEINPSTAPAVKYIYEQFVAGRSRAQIARDLNAKGYKTIFGKPFTTISLSSILKNKIYLGTREYNGLTIENSAPPLIDRALYDAAQKQTAKVYRARAHAKARQEYILTTKLICGTCGSWMVGECGSNQQGKMYYYYICPSRKKGCSCGKHSDRKETLERVIVKACRDALTDEHIIAIAEQAGKKFADEAKDDSALRNAQNALKSAQKRIDNMIDAIEKGIVSDALQARLREAEKDKQDALTALANIPPQEPIPTAAEIAYFLASLRDGDTQNPDFDRNIINTLLNTATIYDLPDKKIKIVLSLNLTKDASTETVICSDIDGNSGVGDIYTNFHIVGKCLQTVMICGRR